MVEVDIAFSPRVNNTMQLSPSHLDDPNCCWMDLVKRCSIRNQGSRTGMKRALPIRLVQYLCIPLAHFAGQPSNEIIASLG
jgi:hypothetical protein